MNILLINHYAGSDHHGMEYRPFYMAREWVKQGHDVTIIASAYSHLRSTQPAVNGDWEEEIIEGIRYVWVQTPLYEGNGAKRVINIFTFVGKLLAKGTELARKYNPDIVIASSTYPLDIYPAKNIAKKTGAKLVFEVHDLWPLTPMELGNLSPYHPFIMVLQRGENTAYKSADKVVSLLPKAKDHMMEHGMDEDKFYYSPNGIVLEQWENQNEMIPVEHRNTIAKLKEEGKLLIGYAGAHGVANALDHLIDAAEILRNEPFAFVLVGKGAEKDRLIKKAKDKGLSNLHFLPAINKNAIPDFLSHMDSLYIGWNRSKLYRFGVSPNKLLDYMMSAKPIIHSIEAGNDLVAESGCGLSCPPEDGEKIAGTIKDLLQLSDHERLEMGKRGHDYVVDNYDYKILAEKFINIL